MKPHGLNEFGDCYVSPPVRGRGLKLRKQKAGSTSRVSPPVRGRGLKLLYRAIRYFFRLSPPVRGRGLKHQR